MEVNSPTVVGFQNQENSQFFNKSKVSKQTNKPMAFNPNACSFVPRTQTSKQTPPLPSDQQEQQQQEEQQEPDSWEDELTQTQTTTTTEAPPAPPTTVGAENHEEEEEDYDEELASELEKLEAEEVEDTRDNVNIVFIGHVDAGKSTISGHILLLSGEVAKRVIDRYEKEAKEKNRDSWWLAFVMDMIDEERARGKTIEVGRATFSTLARRYTILDAPGHRSYVPNMISAAAQADIGILVISARKGEFETGFDRGGQTREHTQLARTVGVRQLVVAINKMDDRTVEWSQERYAEIVEKITPFLKQCGYNVAKEITFVPISGISGHNIFARTSDVASWYQGPSLVEILESRQFQRGSEEAAVRMPLIDKYKDARGNSTFMGKLESGKIVPGMSLVLMPSKANCEVMFLSSDENKNLKVAKPGDNVRVAVKGLDIDTISAGFVCCLPDDYCHAFHQFEAQIVILELTPNKPIFSAGYEAMLHIHTAEEPCVVTRLLGQFDKSGNLSERPPKFVRVGAVVSCQLVLPKPVCIETFKTYPFLGRFTLRDSGKTIAFGKVTNLGPRRRPKKS